MDVQSHTMQLKAQYSSGAQEWHCLSCGRRVLLKLRPIFEKTVLSAGDAHASHSGGLMISAMFAANDAEHQSYPDQLSPDSADNDPDSERSASALGPWLRWAHESGYDDLWTLA